MYASIQNLDAAIFKRAARVLKTHEFRMQLPEMVFGDSEVVYNPYSGLDIKSHEPEGTTLIIRILNINTRNYSIGYYIESFLVITKKDFSRFSGRGLLKKKLLFPALLLLKLKMKALMPIFVALIGLKAMKALILSKLAIAIVLGFVIYQLCAKSGKRLLPFCRKDILLSFKLLLNLQNSNTFSLTNSRKKDLNIRSSLKTALMM